MHQVNINPKAIKALSKFVAAQKDIRYYMNGVLLEIDQYAVTYVATNGHVLAVLREEHKNEGGKPVINTDIYPIHLIIPNEIAQKIKPAKYHEAMQILKYGIGGTLNTGESQECELIDSESDTKTGFKSIDGKFPEWVRTIPAKEPIAYAEGQTFEWMYLHNLQQCYDAIFGKKSSQSSLALYSRGLDKSALVLGEENGFYGVVMPMRGGNWDHHENWTRPATKTFEVDNFIEKIAA